MSKYSGVSWEFSLLNTTSCSPRYCLYPASFSGQPGLSQKTRGEKAFRYWQCDWRWSKQGEGEKGERGTKEVEKKVYVCSSRLCSSAALPAPALNDKRTRTRPTWVLLCAHIWHDPVRG